MNRPPSLATNGVMFYSNAVELVMTSDAFRHLANLRNSIMVSPPSVPPPSQSQQLQAVSLERFCSAPTAVELKAAFHSLLADLRWESAPEIPWRDDEGAVRRTMQTIAADGVAPIWRSHRAADPYAGVGADWAHGSFVAFPPSDVVCGLGYEGAIFPPGVSFVTKFADRVGQDRPVAGDYGLEWIAHNEGSTHQRQQALDTASPVSRLRTKLGDPATTVHDGVNLMYETPVSRDTAAIEERMIARRSRNGGFEVFRIPDSPEWSRVLSKIAELDSTLVSKPRSVAYMPPSAKAGKKCLPVAEIFAKMEAAEKGRPLSATYGHRPDMLETARHENDKLARESKIDSILERADGTLLRDALDPLEGNDLLDVWSAAIDRLSARGAQNLLDVPDNWRYGYSPEIATHISDALQDKAIGFSPIHSVYRLRDAVRAHQPALAPRAELAPAPAHAATAATAAERPELSAGSVQAVGRLRSRLSAIYVAPARPDDASLLLEGIDHTPAEEPYRPAM